MKINKFSQLFFKPILFLFLTAGFFAPGKIVKAADAVTREVNWSGVTAPFRFEFYCRPSETESWTVGGQGGIHYQSIKDDIFSQRMYRLPNEDYYGGFYGVWFNTSGIGWVVGDDGLIFHSTDNGYSWIKQVSGTTDTLKAVTCTDTKNCWILGDNDLLRTKNGGKTWKALTAIDGNAIEFLDTKNGWIVGDNEVYKTENGGETWQTSQIESKENDAHYKAVKFVDKKVGWIGGRDRIAATTDGGKTWKITELENANIVGIVAHDKKTVLAVNRGEYNYCSDDSGKNWKKCYPYQTDDK